METKSRKMYSKGGESELETTSITRRSESQYKPAIQNRATVISRSSTGSFPGALSSRFESSSSRQSMTGLPMGQFAEISSAGVTNFKEERTHEKAEMQDLNNRLANYMEKMRYLEAMNKALEKEIEKLKKGKDVDFEKIKMMYEDELKQARKVIEDLSKEKADADVKVLSLEDEINFVRNERDNEEKDKDDYKKKAEKFGDQIGEYEGEIATLRFHVNGLESDITKLQGTIKRLQQENARLRNDLDTETVAHINEANRAQGLEEELAFITQVYEQEIKELQELARRDTTIEMRDFWKGEMGGALRDIQAEYDSRLNQISSTLEAKYNAQLSQISSSVNRDTSEINFIRDENKKLKSKINDLNSKISELMAQNAALDERNRQLERELKDRDDEMENARLRYESELNKLRREVESVLKEMQILMDAKLSLEMEIAAYRKLLESEEDRYDMKSKFENLGGFSSAHETSMQQTITSRGGYSGSGSASGSGASAGRGGESKPEGTGRLTINRTSRGGLSFDEISPDGKYIVITNKASSYRKKNFSLQGWTIERTFKDGTPAIRYTFPEDRELNSEESLKLFALNAGHTPPHHSKDELLVDIKSWGTGQADTVLKDDSGSEKASHKQTFTS